MNVARQKVVCLLFPDITQLDVTGPAEVFAAAGLFDVEFAAATSSPVVTDGGWSIVPTTTYGEAPDADILLIPGGAGVDLLLEDSDALAFVRRQAQAARWVTSVCTGALVLGAAGLLRGRRATTHWASRGFLADFGAIPAHERFVRDGDLFTAAGVSAGIDMALALVAEVAGEDVAAAAQLEMEYAPEPPFAYGSPEAADPIHVARIRAQVAARRGPAVEAAARGLGL